MNTVVVDCPPPPFSAIHFLDAPHHAFLNYVPQDSSLTTSTLPRFDEGDFAIIPLGRTDQLV
ncbi:hypothetical protein [Moorena sp. SIO3H5]|uniref:hypothetical protein n=1 Tax=Moorena sp. SIO3H5 TaxID=2607834 RepID=UPI0013BDAE65|nr:hypothetical protein [Moorena sp. SIO3H5]NEO74207.1 hypothetical protein [Moorena sp. SIO3H5]